MSRKIVQHKLDAGYGVYITVQNTDSSVVDSGEIFYIGVQGLPSTSVGINCGNDKTNLKIGYTGVYEADFSSFTGAYLRSIYVPANHSGTVLVDLLYSGDIVTETYAPNQSINAESGGEGA